MEYQTKAGKARLQKEIQSTQVVLTQVMDVLPSDLHDVPCIASARKCIGDGQSLIEELSHSTANDKPHDKEHPKKKKGKFSFLVRGWKSATETIVSMRVEWVCEQLIWARESLETLIEELEKINPDSPHSAANTSFDDEAKLLERRKESMRKKASSIQLPPKKNPRYGASQKKIRPPPQQPETPATTEDGDDFIVIDWKPAGGKAQSEATSSNSETTKPPQTTPPGATSTVDNSGGATMVKPFLQGVTRHDDNATTTTNTDEHAAKQQSEPPEVVGSFGPAAAEPASGTEVDDSDCEDAVEWMEWDAAAEDSEQMDVCLQAMLENPKYKIHRCWSGLPEGLRKQGWIKFTETSRFDSQRYHNLIATGCSPEWTDVIEKDIPRTFPEHKLFNSSTGIATTRLKNVLYAYAAYDDEEVGYCQSMNYLAAVLLMVLPEEHAFWGLDYILRNRGMRQFFVDGMPAHAASMEIFGLLLERYHPDLSAHFIDPDKDYKAIQQEEEWAHQPALLVPSMYATEWFTTLWAYRAPLKATLRIWDVILGCGMQVVYQLGMAVMDMMKEKLLRSNFEECIVELKNMTIFEEYDVDDILNKAMTYDIPRSDDIVLKLDMAT